MTWDVEYTDEFGEWWGGLTEAEQVSLAASVQLLEERAHRSGIRTAAASTARNMGTCASFARSKVAARFGRFMPLTRVGWQFC